MAGVEPLSRPRVAGIVKARDLRRQKYVKIWQKKVWEKRNDIAAYGFQWIYA